MTGSVDLEGSGMRLIQSVDAISGWETLDRGYSRQILHLVSLADVDSESRHGLSMDKKP